MCQGNLAATLTKQSRQTRRNHYQTKWSYSNVTTKTHEGYVKTWKEDRFFGFFTITNPPGGGDCFFHGSELERAGIQNIAEGDKARFNLQHDAKSGRSKACDIEMVM
jgi:cold shock protein